MKLRSEEVRAIIHQGLDIAYNAGILIMESSREPSGKDIFSIKLRWMGMKIPIIRLETADNKNPS